MSEQPLHPAHKALLRKIGMDRMSSDAWDVVTSLLAETDALAAELAKVKGELLNTTIWRGKVEQEQMERAEKAEARVAALEAALDSISEIGVSERLDICQAMLHGVMETAKRVLKASASETDSKHSTEDDFQHWLSYSGYADLTGGHREGLRAAYYAGANVVLSGRTGDEVDG